MSFTISHLAGGGLICTYRCNSRCGHCAYFSGSGWSNDYMDEAGLSRAARALDRLGCSSVHIGGGEPFLDIESLASLSGACVRKGIGIEYVETNASWYRADGDIDSMLHRLIDAGIGTLLISISPFHNEYIPFSKTLGAMEACDRVGMSVFPWGTQFLDDMASLDHDRPHRLSEYEREFGDGYLEAIPSRYWVSTRGRAVATFRPFATLSSAEEIAAGSGPCGELHDVSHFHIDLYGNYVPGVCSGLGIEVEDLGHPLDDAKYPIMNDLALSGIGALFERAMSVYDFTPRRSYSGKCDLCYEIRRHIVESGEYVGRDLEPAELYQRMG